MRISMASETMAAWAAIVISAGGGLITTAIHYGSTNQQIASISQKQKETDDHVAKHDDQLAAIQQQNARIEQKLDDVRDTVHDVQDRVHGSHR